ncbi:hypothetical protein PYW08_005141 [Mythimna loreyi]|uniref:Uncharacterized protein n=1 Tax=Mythimna loreyi TaxID=667449 RepID=A0ACC2QI84_9NEOP|nr:hypothetical protein PYW08_005141 [Mythimna loreyi]
MSTFNWLLVQWLDESFDVVHVKSLVSPSEELRLGEVVKVYWRGEQETVTLVGYARDREPLLAMIQKYFEEEAGPNCKSENSPNRTHEEVEEEADYSCSESSWAPSPEDEGSAESDMENTRVKRNIEQIESPKEIKIKKKRRQTSLTELMSIGNLLPDATEWQNEELKNEKIEDKLVEINDLFSGIFNFIDNLKIKSAEQLSVTPKEPSDQEVVHTNSDDEFNRSDDNVLITNKFNAAETNEQVESSDEWIPIGSGITKVHKDQYSTVNWKCHTLCTRTLLIALFPRRVLATHSLTGKKSPAFKDKPAKMCLDPKIVSDIILEVRKRFGVRENEVRSIITTKCADECKMFKTRLLKRKSQYGDNVPLDSDDDMDVDNDQNDL